jgi:toxin ParE1/3/4
MLVRWTKPAADDLSQICDYTEKRLGAAQARRAAKCIYEAANVLKDMPLHGRVGRKPGTRELKVSGLPFVIVYRAGNEAAEIIRILHGSQQWP